MVMMIANSQEGASPCVADASNQQVRVRSRHIFANDVPQVESTCSEDGLTWDP